jgi:hypothetical protein
MSFRFIVFLVILQGSMALQAADWLSCRASKVEVLQLEKSLRSGKKLKGYASGAAMKKARRRKDDWLWKHCRAYSSRLRDVEASMM